MNWVLSSRRRLTTLALGFFTLGVAVSCTTTPRKKTEVPRFNFTRMNFSIGETNAFVLVFQHRQPSPTFINVHDDENTSVEAGKAVIEATSGRLIELAHSGRRHLRFTIDGKSYAVDPNRIFSEAGIRTTLERQGDYSPAAHQAVKQFALQFLERFALQQEPVIVALHNTVDGNYSIESYRPGAQHAEAVADLFVSPNRSRYDFFYVTDQRFFDYLKARDFNVILQDNPKVPDDGSLSVFFATKGVPYLNIEAQLGQLDRQIEMVRAVRQMLDDLKLVRK
jgi:hypothetical protein